MKLYSYYRSTAAYRVRIALNYKNIDYVLMPVNLIQEEHKRDEYKRHNLQARVPTWVDNEVEIGQSSAILEYLEEKYPKPPLLPVDIKARAWVRYLSQIIISDTHPLNNVGVLKFLKDPLGLDPAQITCWYHHWLKQSFDVLEALLSQHADCQQFCWGKTPTFADLCLIPQIYNAHRFDFKMDDYPTLCRINDNCLAQPSFYNARPENQPDFIPPIVST